MRWIYRIIASLVILLFFTLLVNDFFQSFEIPFGLSTNQVFLIMVFLIIISAFVERKIKVSDEQSSRIHNIITVGLLMVIAIFTLVGGNSSSGIGIDSIGLWIAVAIALFIDYRKRKA